MNLDKPIEEYNKTEIKKLVLLLKGNLKGRVAFNKRQEKIQELSQHICLLENNNNFSIQLLSNISIAEEQMKNTILYERSFGTSLMVENIWNALHGKVNYNKIDNIIDKYGRS